MGRPRMRWLEGVERDLREVKFKRWRQKAVDREEWTSVINPLKPELNPIYYLLALLTHHFLHVSRIRVKSLTFRRLMSYIYIWSTYS